MRMTFIAAAALIAVLGAGAAKAETASNGVQINGATAGAASTQWHGLTLAGGTTLNALVQ